MNHKYHQMIQNKYDQHINKYEPKVSSEAPNPYLDFLINPSFQGVNMHFILSFENEENRTDYTKYYLPTVKIKDYNAMIDGRNFFYQSVKNNLKIYDNIRRITIGQGDDYTTGCLITLIITIT